MILDSFMSEHICFRKRREPFDNAFWWNSSHLDTGEVHIWHETYSLQYTKALGAVACRVTSKILGIGNAERAWGAVKHLKTGKRGKLGSSSTRMQATIFAKSCIDEARTRAKYKGDDGTCNGWTDEDIAFLKGSRMDVEDRSEIFQRVFRVWEEEWELDIINNRLRDEVSITKLEKKYKGIKFYDVDEQCKEDHLFEVVRVDYVKRQGLFCIAMKNGKANDTVSWAIEDVLICCHDNGEENNANIRFEFDSNKLDPVDKYQQQPRSIKQKEISKEIQEEEAKHL